MTEDQSIPPIQVEMKDGHVYIRVCEGQEIKLNADEALDVFIALRDITDKLHEALE